MDHSSESSDCNEQFEKSFGKEREIIEAVQNTKDSQPTKLRVKNFKNRVFQLLKIYASKSQDANPLIQCFKQEMFFNETSKLQELVHIIAHKQNLTAKNLQQLVQYYKAILLYRAKNQLKIAAQFLKLVKKLQLFGQQAVCQIVLSMLKSFAYQRKCKIHINFFLYFFRKYQHHQEIKKKFIQNINLFLQDDKLRNAQKKQLTKILQKLDKSMRVNSKAVKKEEFEKHEIDINLKNKNKQTPAIQKIKKYQEVNKKDRQLESEAEEDQTKKGHKKIPQEQLEKLQRIKSNKKNKRRGKKQGESAESEKTNRNIPEKKKKNGQSEKQRQRSQLDNFSNQRVKSKEPQNHQNNHMRKKQSPQRFDKNRKINSASKPNFNKNKNA